MKVFAPRWFFLLVVLAVCGCRDEPAPAPTRPVDVEDEIRVNLARLGPEDRRLAEQQKYCPMMEGVRLGAMGPPRKVTVKGVSVFVCCENCARAAHDDPETAGTRIKELQESGAKQEQ
jgi:hypothetical protein